MISQTEWDVRNAPSNQPAIVWSKPRLATQCANPQCSEELLYLREGRLALLDMESHANDPPRPDDGAFAMKCVPSKYFWLCRECAEIYILKRWTTSGLVLVHRNQNRIGAAPIWLLLQPAAGDPIEPVQNFAIRLILPTSRTLPTIRPVFRGFSVAQRASASRSLRPKRPRAPPAWQQLQP